MIPYTYHLPTTLLPCVFLLPRDSLEWANPRLSVQPGSTLTLNGTTYVIGSGNIWLDHQTITYPPDQVHRQTITNSGISKKLVIISLIFYFFLFFFFLLSLLMYLLIIIIIIIKGLSLRRAYLQTRQTKQNRKLDQAALAVGTYRINNK